MPRTKLPPEQKRNHFVQVGFTADEIQYVDQRCDEKQSRADLLRECFFRRFGLPTPRTKPQGGSK